MPNRDEAQFIGLRHLVADFALARFRISTRDQKLPMEWYWFVPPTTGIRGRQTEFVPLILHQDDG